jgi:DNA-binding transcriptional LysR family regulator
MSLTAAFTEVGQQFFKTIQPIISELESAISDFTNTKENLNITVGLPEFFASEVFVPRLSESVKSTNISCSTSENIIYQFRFKALVRKMLYS